MKTALTTLTLTALALVPLLASAQTMVAPGDMSAGTASYMVPATFEIPIPADCGLVVYARLTWERGTMSVKPSGIVQDDSGAQWMMVTKGASNEYVDSVVMQAEVAPSSADNVAHVAFWTHWTKHEAEVEIISDLVCEEPVGCTPDAYESNDEPATATEFVPEDIAQGTICYADEDWFHVAREPGCVLSGRLLHPLGDYVPGEVADVGLLKIELYDGAGEYITTKVSFDGRIDFDIPKDLDEAYVVVTGADDLQTSDQYTLLIQQDCATVAPALLKGATLGAKAGLDDRPFNAEQTQQ